MLLILFNVVLGWARAGLRLERPLLGSLCPLVVVSGLPRGFGARRPSRYVAVSRNDIVTEDDADLVQYCSSVSSRLLAPRHLLVSFRPPRRRHRQPTSVRRLGGSRVLFCERDNNILILTIVSRMVAAASRSRGSSSQARRSLASPSLAISTDFQILLGSLAACIPTAVGVPNGDP